MTIFIIKLIVLVTINRCNCAYQEVDCQNEGGTCQEDTRSCSGDYISGKCPTQPKNVKCCIGGERVYQEGECTLVNGVCMKTSVRCSTGTFLDGKCPTQSNDVKCCLQNNYADGWCEQGINKYASTLHKIFGHEGLCQNSENDNGNMFQGRRGYTCMGITPGIGYVNRDEFPGCAQFTGIPADFVKWCYDQSVANFKIGAARIYREDYFNVCEGLEQPAFYVCCDISVNSGPPTALKFRRQTAGPAGSNMKSYARELNELHRDFYRRIGGPNLPGWLNRADARDRYINTCD